MREMDGIVASSKKKITYRKKLVMTNNNKSIQSYKIPAAINFR